jgi:hypothetical protein
MELGALTLPKKSTVAKREIWFTRYDRFAIRMTANRRNFSKSLVSPNAAAPG